MLALPACGSRAQEAPTPVVAAGDSVDLHNGPPGATLPNGLPTYPSADDGPVFNLIRATAEGRGEVFAFHAGDPPAQVVAFYVPVVRQAGYVVVDQSSTEAAASLTARNPRGQIFRVVATGIAAGSQVRIIFGGDRR
jgi:hypothetical protein